MIDKKKLITLEWGIVDKYLRKDSNESMRLAAIEADNIFLKIVEKKGYRAKLIDERIYLALKEIKRPEIFLKAREKAQDAKNKIGFDFDNPYSAREIIDTYKEAIEDLLFGIIDGRKSESLKIRFWRFYYPFFTNRKRIYRFLVWFLLFILLMLFIADTELGKSIFDYLIDKIHLIIRIILFILFIAFSIIFFVTLTIVLLESRLKRRYEKKRGVVDK